MTDWRKVEGKNVIILTRAHPNLAAFDPYFDSMSFDKVEVRGVMFYAIKGHGFRYGPYKDAFMGHILARFYDRSGWHKGFACPIRDRL